MPQVASKKEPRSCAAESDHVVERLGAAAGQESAVTAALRRRTGCVAISATGRQSLVSVRRRCGRLRPPSTCAPNTSTFFRALPFGKRHPCNDCSEAAATLDNARVARSGIRPPRYSRLSEIQAISSNKAIPGSFLLAPVQRGGRPSIRARRCARQSGPIRAGVDVGTPSMGCTPASTSVT